MSVPTVPVRQVRRPLPKFQTGAKQALANSQLRRNLHKATHTIRDKRAEAPRQPLGVLRTSTGHVTERKETCSGVGA